MHHGSIRGSKPGLQINELFEFSQAGEFEQPDLLRRRHRNTRRPIPIIHSVQRAIRNHLQQNSGDVVNSVAVTFYKLQQSRLNVPVSAKLDESLSIALMICLWLAHYSSFLRTDMRLPIDIGLPASSVLSVA